jgi:cell division protein FtsX
MNKKIMKKCIGTFMVSLLLSTSSLAILLTINELTNQGINPEQIQVELQNMLNSINTNNQNRGHNSVSLRGFYGNGIFSCRGFA